MADLGHHFTVGRERAHHPLIPVIIYSYYRKYAVPLFVSYPKYTFITFEFMDLGDTKTFLFNMRTVHNVECNVYLWIGTFICVQLSFNLSMYLNSNFLHVMTDFVHGSGDMRYDQHDLYIVIAAHTSKRHTEKFSDL